MKRRKISTGSSNAGTEGGAGTSRSPKQFKRDCNVRESVDKGQIVQIKKGKCQSGKVKKGSFEHRFERRRYLNQLAQEFQTTTVMECKEQVLANLANFAYDPYNYHFFQEIGIIPIFLAELSVNRSETLTDFAMAGICNCSADKRIQKEILRKDGLQILKSHVHFLSSVNTLLSVITCLVNFLSSGHHNDFDNMRGHIADEELHVNLLNLLKEHRDKRVTNVVQVLLDELKEPT